MAQERRRVCYSGRVQGVGFRFTARHLAREFPISGYVRNLQDGRVELLAQGETADVDGFLAAIQREFGDKIHDVHEQREETGDPLPAGFEIRY